MKQTLIWTALPNGIVPASGSEGAYLRLSVFVSMRLDRTASDPPTLRLSNFPDLQDWPAKVAGLTFTVRLEGKGDYGAERVSPAQDPSPSELWTSLFPSTTYVKPYSEHVYPDPATLKVDTFSVGNLHARVREVYQGVSLASPTELPRIDQVTPALQPAFKLLEDITFTPQRTAQINSLVRSQMQTANLRTFRTPDYRAPTTLRRAGSPRVAPRALPRAATLSPQLQALPPATLDFHQVQAFYTPTVATLPPLTKAGLLQSMDFHKILASLCQFPEMLRRLGLIIDLKVPYTAAMAGATKLRVIPSWPATPTAPTTMITLNATTFAAQPRPVSGDQESELENGMLRLNDPDLFEIGQVDVDGAALKLMNLAKTVTQAPAFALARPLLRPLTPAAPTTPATGTGGGENQLAPNTTALHLMTPPALALSPAALTNLPTPPKPEVPAAALPALRSTGFWVAHLARADYFLAAKRRAQTLDNALASGNVVLYFEDLIRGYRPDVWDDTAGRWNSLCERVGTYRLTKLNKTLAGVQDEGWIGPGATRSETDATQYAVNEVLFRWDNWSLVAPRPGAGVQGENAPDDDPGRYGLNVTFTPTPHSLPRLRFGRSYRLRARAVDLAGNSLSLAEAGEAQASGVHTYLRSEPLVAPMIFPRHDPEKPPYKYQTPPNQAGRLAKQPFGGPAESVLQAVIRSYNETPAQDSVPTQQIAERHLAPPRTSEQMAELHGKFDGPEGVKGDAATYQLIAEGLKDPAPYYDTDQMPLTYLPDPLAAGVLLRFQPEAFAAAPGEQTLQVPFDGPWPKLNPIRLVLEEPKAGQKAGLELDAGNKRLVHVRLPKGDVAKVLISTYMRPEDLKLMEVWGWTAEQVVAPRANAVSLSPVERVQLQRDLPNLRALPTWRARLAIPQADLDRLQAVGQKAETGQHWMITPYTTLTVVHATQQPLGVPQYKVLNSERSAGWTYAKINTQTVVSGKSTAKLDLIAVWDEPIDPLEDRKWRTIHGRQRVGELNLNRSDVDLTHQWQHEFHDTKYRRVTYRTIATSRYRECFPYNEDDIAQGKVTITRQVQSDLDVLSTARPLAPKVLYVIPTFAWEQTTSGNKTTSKRGGGGLRVYLERPWFSSGDKEQLGIVLPPQPATPSGVGAVVAAFGPPNVPEALRPFVSQWGADPLWRGESLPRILLLPEDFPKGKKDSDLSLDELPGGPRVQVAGHDVGYDEERQLWYCDVEIKAGAAYFPFVRLALARYQPMSLNNDLKLSRVVLADFAQLTPDRTAVLTRNTGSRAQVNVSVTGPTYIQSTLGRTPEDLAAVEVTVEENNPDLKGAVAWTAVPNAVFPLKLMNFGSATATWAADITLPAAKPGRRQRLVIREYELYPQEGGVSTATLVAALPKMVRARRLVYADVLELQP